MEQDKFQIVYVTSKVPEDVLCSLCSKLVNELPVQFQGIHSIPELFPRLSMPNENIDFVVLDVDDLYHVGGIDFFDLVRTLHTLIHCTVFRIRGEVKPKKRNTKIVAMIGEDTSSKLVKEVLSMPEISFLTVRYGPRVDYGLVKRSVENYINDGERAPKFITDLVKSPRTDRHRPEDTLTVRQQQVYDLIITRGSSNKHIAKILSISESTVKLHIGAILKKYGLRSRTQLAVFSKKKIESTEVQI